MVLCPKNRKRQSWATPPWWSSLYIYIYIFFQARQVSQKLAIDNIPHPFWAIHIYIYIFSDSVIHKWKRKEKKKNFLVGCRKGSSLYLYINGNMRTTNNNISLWRRAWCRIRSIFHLGCSSLIIPLIMSDGYGHTQLKSASSNCPYLFLFIRKEIIPYILDLSTNISN